MDIIVTLVVGLIVGALAKLIMPGKDPGGIIITMLLGIVGAFVAFGIGRAMGFYSPNEPAGWLASVLGAVLVLAVYRAVSGRRSLPHA